LNFFALRFFSPFGCFHPLDIFGTLAILALWLFLLFGYSRPFAIFGPFGLFLSLPFFAL
jgi:hypothetical protein